MDTAACMCWMWTGRNSHGFFAGRLTSHGSGLVGSSGHYPSREIFGKLLTRLSESDPTRAARFEAFPTGPADPSKPVTSRGNNGFT